MEPHKRLRIEISIDDPPELEGTVTVGDADPAVSIEFVGWLGLIHALSRVVGPVGAAQQRIVGAHPLTG